MQSKSDKPKKRAQAKIEDFRNQSASGMVQESETAVARRKRKRTRKLIAIIVASALALAVIGGTVAGLLTAQKEGSFFYKLYMRGKLAAPKNLRVEDFNQQTDFALLIKWDETSRATDYTLEIVYGLYPDAPKSYNVALNGRYIERKRGELRYRVRANNLSGSSDFTQWQSLQIEPLKLELPEITLYKDDTYLYCTWSEVKYKFFNDYGAVFYQYKDGGTFKEEPFEPWENAPQYSTKREIKIPLENLDGRCEIFTLKVRPINYSIFWSTERFTYLIINEPTELYDTYELSEEWAEARFDLTE